MEEQIKSLQKDKEFWKGQSEFYQNLFERQLDLISKLLNKLSDSTSKNEHLQLIKKYLSRQDVSEVAKKLRVSFAYVENILNDECFDNNVLNELYNKALINKKSLLADYEKMVTTLKN
ncbi:hypothetical protein SAMN05444371_3423 [Epilithonimonas mollis]|uniref:Uncharacterized protein n=2 Tax=Epilithonimonas mollis TaxID=216903 RepID=A0A1M6UQP7_9FLAO|nr:hypothetical protein SAMN05444371_3423 [Epilithonimonas mollis]